MPYRRRRKKSRFNKWSGKARTAIGVASSALAIAQGIKKLINVEQKFHPLVLSNQQLDGGDTGVIYSLSQIAQGLDEDDRVGNSILAKSYFFRYNVDWVDATSVGRLIIFIDKHQSGVVPTTAQVLQTISPLAPLNRNADGRFKILWDKLFSVSDQMKQRVGKKFIELNHHIKYIGTLGVAASNGNGSLYLLTISDNANNPVIDFNGRLRYIDN